MTGPVKHVSVDVSLCKSKVSPQLVKHMAVLKEVPGRISSANPYAHTGDVYVTVHNHFQYPLFFCPLIKPA